MSDAPGKTPRGKGAAAAGGAAPSEPAGGPSTSSPPTADDMAEALKPFQDATTKYVQGAISAHESAIREAVDSHLRFQQQAREIENEVYNSVADATRKYFDKRGQATTGNMEEMWAAQARAHLEYENDVRETYANAHSRLQGVAGQLSSPEGGDPLGRLSSRQQDAYKEYVADLQQAWSSSTTLDPQIVRAIATHMLLTLGG